MRPFQPCRGQYHKDLDLGLTPGKWVIIIEEPTTKEGFMRDAQQTAILLAVVLNRSAQPRARVSTKTIKMLGTRKHLRRAFVAELTDTLAEYSWTLSEIDSGGYAAIRTKALEAAKPVTAKRWLTDDERRALRRGKANWSAFEKEAAPEQEQPDEDEDV